MPKKVICNLPNASEEINGIKFVHTEEGVISAEAGVNMVIVQQIVLVVFPGGEDRIQINAVDTQRFQIIHILCNPLQRSAELSPHGLLFKSL